MPKAVLMESRVIWLPEGHMLGSNERWYNADTDADLPLHDGYDFDALEAESRRNERKEKFSETIDKMNIVWYNSLTQDQKTNLETWRQQWLDYPSTGISPTESLVEGIF